MAEVKGDLSNISDAGKRSKLYEVDVTFLDINSLRDKWLTGQHLQAQVNSGRRKQVLVSTVKTKLCNAGWTVKLQQDKHC